MPPKLRFSHEYACSLDVEKAAKTLDLPLVRKWRHAWVSLGDFTWVSLVNADMHALFDSRVRHMKAETATKKLVRRLHLKYERTDLVAVLFWHNVDGANDLPSCAWDGAQSAAENGGFSSVELYSYQRFRRLPPGVTAKHAERVLSYEMFNVYLRVVAAVGLGDSAIAHVADLVCLKACVDTVHAYAVMIDCDTIWFRNMPLPDPQHSDYVKAYGHVFATHKIKKCSRRKIDIKAALVERRMQYSRVYGDYTEIVPPFLFFKGSPVARSAANAVVTAMDELVSNPTHPPAPYNFIMKLVKVAINDHGCRGAIVDHELFSPLDYWLRKTVIQPGSSNDYHK